MPSKTVIEYLCVIWSLRAEGNLLYSDICGGVINGERALVTWGNQIRKHRSCPAKCGSPSLCSAGCLSPSSVFAYSLFCFCLLPLRSSFYLAGIRWTHLADHLWELQKMSTIHPPPPDSYVNGHRRRIPLTPPHTKFKFFPLGRQSSLLWKPTFCSSWRKSPNWHATDQEAHVMWAYLDFEGVGVIGTGREVCVHSGAATEWPCIGAVVIQAKTIPVTCSVWAACHSAWRGTG